MSTPATSRRAALALSLAATLAFFGAALMLHAGRALSLLGSGPAPSARPGASLLAIVLLLAVTGALLLGLAAHELFDAPRPLASRGVPRRPAGTRRTTP